MFLPNISFTNIFISNALCKTRGFDLYVKPMTLLDPFIQENAKNDHFTMEGSYVVYNRSYVNYIQMGYYAPQSRAIIQSKEPIKRKNFKLDVFFTLDNVQKGGNGFGFWISEPMTQGGFYGRNKDYKGFGVVVCTKYAPYVEYMCSGGKRSKRIYLKDKMGSHQISFEHQYPMMKIYYKPGKSIEKQLLIETKSTVESNYIFGISGHTGGSSTVMKVYSVMGTSMRGLKESFVVGQQQKSSPVVMVIGIISVIALIYYLTTRQKKTEKDLS